jgi:hypothetical protein
MEKFIWILMLQNNFIIQRYNLFCKGVKMPALLILLAVLMVCPQYFLPACLILAAFIAAARKL